MTRGRRDGWRAMGALRDWWEIYWILSARFIFAKQTLRMEEMIAIRSVKVESGASSDSSRGIVN